MPKDFFPHAFILNGWKRKSPIQTHTKWHRHGLNIKRKSVIKKKLQLILTVILKHPVLTSTVTEVNPTVTSSVHSKEDILP